jgi:hypothetical protein
MRTIKRAMSFLLFLLLTVLPTSVSACGRQGMSTEEIVKRVRSEIALGMTRSEVEQRLKTLPVTYVYVTRASLEMTSETTFEGKLLSGRFDVLTPHEPDLTIMKQAAIYIELDEQERVVNVRVRAFGFTPEEE